MKKFFTIIILAAVMVAAAGCTGYAANNDGNRGYPAKVTNLYSFHYKQVKKSKKFYVAEFYDGKKLVGTIKTKRRMKVYVVNSEEVYGQFLRERKNNFIVVEVIKGECVNDEGDGVTTDGYYISYKRVDGHEAGARYTTFCVYANNNYEDDVLYRIDYRG